MNYNKIVSALLQLQEEEGSLMMLASALRTFEKLLPEATRLFQNGGEFPGVIGWGDDCIAGGFLAMARFCEAHKEQFMREAKS